MNTKKLEQLLLLEQSGELSPKQRRLLDQELAASEKARRLRDQLRQISAAIPAPAAQPAPDAAARIAARLHQAPGPMLAFLPAWKPALAAAAVLALLLGVRTFHAKTQVLPEPAVASATAEEEVWTDPLEQDFAELESMISTLATNSLDISEI